ncbi:MAG: flagellar filament capping protein FliD [Sterolibacterium sp.]|nr:flagellar filament capping protein FliD [Sterolibacterium sp.]
MASTPALSSPGLGSGLDVNGLVSKLMSVEQRPLAALNTKEAGYQAKLSAFGSLKGALSSLQTAVGTLTSSSTFTSRTASGSDPTVLTATAANSAAVGSYAVNVTQLAKNLTIRSDTAYAAITDTFNTGSLDITVGATTKTVTIDSTNNTLDGIRNAINAASAGVTATIVNDGSTNRLVLTAGNTGSAGAFTVAATDAGSGGTNVLTNLAYAGGAGVAGATLRMQPADDAQLSINGLSVTRSNNTFSDVIEGLSFSLSKTGTSNVTVSRNTSSISNALNGFIKAYNDVNKMLHDTTAFNASTGKASILTGDGAVRNIGSQLKSILGAQVSGLSGGVSSLSDLGVSVQKDGSLSVNGTKLQAALDNPAMDVVGLFTSNTSGNTGIGRRFSDALSGMIGPTGIISGKTEGINSSIADIGKQRSALQVKLTSIESRYRSQFTALDTLMSKMTQTTNYLTQQLDQLAKQTPANNR